MVQGAICLLLWASSTPSLAHQPVPTYSTWLNHHILTEMFDIKIAAPSLLMTSNYLKDQLKTFKECNTT